MEISTLDKTLQRIYNSDTDLYKESTMKYGICMATYQRRNGKSPNYIIRSFNSILSQSASNWHLYLVGDKYEDNDEFNKIVSLFPKEKITYINLPNAIERENVENSFELWKIAGSNAFNVANNMALKDGCDYILHYDDDDIWHPKKIQILNFICTIYTTPAFIYHYSTHVNPKVIPIEKITTLGKNTLLPRSCNVIHSACCAHKSIFNEFKYEGYVPGRTQFECGDQLFLNYVNNYIKEQPDKFCIFIPIFLSNHDTELEG